MYTKLKDNLNYFNVKVKQKCSKLLNFDVLRLLKVSHNVIILKQHKKRVKWQKINSRGYAIKKITLIIVLNLIFHYNSI